MVGREKEAKRSRMFDSEGYYRIVATGDLVEVFAAHDGSNFYVVSVLMGERYRPTYDEVDHKNELTPLEVLAWAAL